MLKVERRRQNHARIGSLIRAARERQEMTQKALADYLGLEYYTMISQIELGYIATPPALWVPLGTILKMDMEEWVLICLSEIQPEVYSALFGSSSREAAETALKTLRKVTH